MREWGKGQGEQVGYEDGARGRASKWIARMGLMNQCAQARLVPSPEKIIAKVDGGGNENNLPGIGKWLRKKKLAAPHPSPRLQFQRTVKAFCCKRG